jgi:predicted NAD/FAD-dependent oxidoreductase
MNAPVKALLDGMDVSCGSRAVRLASISGEWIVHLEDGPAHGPFGSLVLAIPAPEAAELLATAGFGRITELIVQLGSVRIAPCWSALAAFDRRLPLDNAPLHGEDPLAWAARNGTKPGRGDGEAWTLHARPAWSAERLEWRSEEVAPVLLREFAAAVGFQTPEPSYLQAHRWRYALVERLMGRSCVWDPALRLGMCGDWCLGPRVEAASLSGRAMAAALANAGAPL